MTSVLEQVAVNSSIKPPPVIWALGSANQENYTWYLGDGQQVLVFKEALITCNNSLIRYKNTKRSRQQVEKLSNVYNCFLSYGRNS